MLWHPREWNEHQIGAGNRHKRDSRKRRQRAEDQAEEKLRTREGKYAMEEEEATDRLIRSGAQLSNNPENKRNTENTRDVDVDSHQTIPGAKLKVWETNNLHTCNPHR